MTAGELIQELSKYDPDMTIILSRCDCDNGCDCVGYADGIYESLGCLYISREE